MHDLERWSDIRKLLERPGKITGAGFEPDPAILEFLQDDARVLVVGAGADFWTLDMQPKLCQKSLGGVQPPNDPECLLMTHC